METTLHTSRIGVILGQIGTPDQPNARSVKTYLKRFLSDRRIIDYPSWLWQPLLRGIILQTRPRRSANMYKQIWGEHASPLWTYSEQQRQQLQLRLGENFQVELGLSFTEQDTAKALDKLRALDISRIVIMPLFPQYSSTTTASLYEEAARSAYTNPAQRLVPDLRFAGAFHTHPAYIEAMRQHLCAQIRALPAKPDYYLLSFHGIPQRYAHTGDPYPVQCLETAQLLAQAMNWSSNEWQMAFQSRFGPEKWLEPATDQVLMGLAQQGVQRPFVFAPGFVTDCLETLHELGIEGREQFQHGGGDPNQYVAASCLNDHEAWLDFLADYVRQHALGWDTPEIGIISLG